MTARDGSRPTAPGFHVIIPARLGSSRLPRKPLADIAGVPMVVRVARQALASQALSVTVAADDNEIIDACRAHGVAAVLTRPDHPSGSDRLAEACDLLRLGEQEVVVNVQGDEPLIEPALIDDCAHTLGGHPDCPVATVGHPLRQREDWHNPNVVKLVRDAAGRALYFSRAALPFWRDGPDAAEPQDCPGGVLRHVGLYAYRVGYLRRFPTLVASPLEQAEMLEQLRVLWHGDRIAVHVTRHAPAAGVDTPDDLERVRRLLGSIGSNGD